MVACPLGPTPFAWLPWQLEHVWSNRSLPAAASADDGLA